MLDLLLRPFDTAGFVPRWACGQWTPAHGYLHIVSDVGVWSAYFAIPLVLWHFARRRADLPFRNLLWLFGAFIFFCGLTHLMDAVLFRWPAYRLSGLLKLATAVASWATVVALVRVIPRVLRMRTPESLEQEVQARTEELTRVNAELVASEERYRQLFEASPHPMWVYDRDTLSFLAVNAAAAARYGWTRDEFLALTIKDIRPAEDVPALLDDVVAAAAGRSGAGVWRHRLRDGRLIRVRVVGHSIRFAGRPAGLVLAQDVTDQLQAEEALQANEQMLRRVIDADPNFIVVKDRDGRFVLGNRALAAAYGTTPDGLTGRRDGDFSPTPSELARFTAADRMVFDAGARFFVTEEALTDAAGRRRWLRTTKRPLAGPDGRPDTLLAVSVDLTDLRAAAEALAASNRLYQLLADHGNDVVMLLGAGGDIRYVSPSCERLTGYSPAAVAAGGMWGLVHPDDRPAAERAWATALTGETTTVEWRCRQKDGRYLWAETVLTPAGGGADAQLVASSRDVTTRRALEDQVRQAQKLEAIGHLAGGVAHDFNNLLTVVTGCGELLRHGMAADDPARPLADDIVRAGERGAALTRQLLAFSRQQILRVEVFDPNAVVRDTATLLGRLLGEDVRLVTALDPAAGRVRADSGQAVQVLLNLAVNGRDAMPRGGTLTVETAAVEVPATGPRYTPDARPGWYVRLTVTDTGTGMTPEVQARLFEPFFTTKEPGKGTGLGLATVYGIVRQSGGFVTVTSAVGRGSAFAVHLPRFDGEADPTSAANPTPAGGRELVLLVEDDESVRALAVAILTRQGYRVESADGGAAALELWDRLPAPPDLVLTDVIMPGMSGRELAEVLLARNPTLRVGFLSGYTADAVLRHGVEEERAAFLQKPYTPDSLARFARRLLDDESH